MTQKNIDRAVALTEIARLVTLALQLQVPARPLRPLAATLEQFAEYEELQAEFAAANAERAPLFDEARRVATDADLPRGVWLKVELGGDAMAVRIKDGKNAAGREELRFRLAAWMEPAPAVAFGSSAASALD